MRVGIYHPWVYVKSGLERTIMELKRRSRHEWEIYTGYYDADGTYPELRDMSVTVVKPLSVQRRYGTVIKAAGTIATTKLDMANLDALVVSSDGLGAFINFANPGLRSICLCFTPLRAAYDPEYRARLMSPNAFRRSLQRVAEGVFRSVDRLAWAKFEHVFCISEEVRRRVVQAKLFDEGGIDIAYPGIDEASRCVSDERERFLFLPGRIMWTKNIELAIDAFKLFKHRTGSDFTLRIAGMVDGKSQSYFASLRERVGNESGIEFVLDPSDEEMRDNYRRCYAVLFAAFNEDLGITPMEAGSFGKVAVAVNRGGPREIIVDKSTGLLVEPDAASYAAAIETLVADPDLATRMGVANYERSSLYTWERFVRTIDDYLDRSGNP